MTFRPTTKYGDTKYEDKNHKGVKLGGVKLQDSEWDQLGELYSFGLAKDTWANYNTAECMLRNCFEEKGIPLELPLKEDDILVFIHWLAFTRNLAGTTVDTYLSGIRQMHVARGFEGHSIRTEKVKTIIKGLKHKRVTEKRRAGEENRRPITVEILAVLKGRIADSDFLGRIKIKTPP